MFFFGRKSTERLVSCHDDLRRVAELGIRTAPIDFFIVCGHRKRIEQDAAFLAGNSKVRWPNSKHNQNPSLAFDFAPVQDPWSNKPRALARYAFLAGVFWFAAAELDVKIRWGSDWDRDGDFEDQSFMDWGHIELIDTEVSTRHA